MTFVPTVTWQLPAWMLDEIDLTSPRPSDAAKMRLAIDIAARNVEHGGGPFGAVVFDRDTHRVVAPGANFVVTQGSSLMHAETVAILFAQAKIGNYTLAAGEYELVTSSAPCVQCLGALYWSGLRRLVCGAPVADAQAVGFDEGPRAVDWKEQLALRGILVTEDVLAAEAGAVLARYKAEGRTVYNARS